MYPDEQDKRRYCKCTCKGTTLLDCIDELGSGPGYGFIVWAPEGDICRDVSIQGCAANGNHTADIKVLTEKSGYIRSVSIVGNTVSRNREKGISLETRDGGRGSQILGVLIEGNQIHHNYAPVLTLMEAEDEMGIFLMMGLCPWTRANAAIAVEGADHVSVVGNKAYNTESQSTVVESLRLSRHGYRRPGRRIRQLYRFCTILPI